MKLPPAPPGRPEGLAVSIYRRLAPRIFVPLYERLSGRRPWTELRRLRVLQWRSPEELEARALEKLRSLLVHAYAHVPYYRELFARAGLRPEDIATVSDLSRLPLTGKAELRANFPARVVADNLPARRRQKAGTSGSTGLPFEFYHDRASSAVRDAAVLLSQEWAGVAHADAEIRITAHPRWTARRLRYLRARDAAHWLFLGERLARLDGTALTAADFLAALGRPSRRYAYYIQGYPSYISRLAARLLQTGGELPLYPVVVITGGETQTATDVATIERAFRCPVVNRYACWETHFLAQTCPDNPVVLHVNAEGAILRVVRDDGSGAAPGESGRVVVTDLGNWVMPFINYDIGDWAVAGARCPCGRGLPTLMGLDGRTSEVIQTPGGKVVAAGTLQYLRRVVPRLLDFVWEYQAVQTAADAVTLRVVPTPRFTPEYARHLELELEDFLGPGMVVRVEAVDRIPSEASGKRLIIKSELARH